MNFYNFIITILLKIFTLNIKHKFFKKYYFYLPHNNYFIKTKEVKILITILN